MNAYQINACYTHKASCIALLIFTTLCSSSQLHAQSNAPLDAKQLVSKAIDYWRSKTSYTEVSMTIHRPAWERRMSLHGWTRGIKDSVIIFTSPVKDAGNATLKLDDDMWMFTPKLNQVIKLPASMMSQSWMGSDFSYNDLARTDQIIEQYDHHHTDTQYIDGHTVYTIESIPKESAPVVWGKEVLQIRDDHILLSEYFYDQDMKLVKYLKTLKTGPLGNREFPLVMRITNAEKADHWTELVNTAGHFDIELPDYIFTRSNLRNPRHWQVP